MEHADAQRKGVTKDPELDDDRVAAYLADRRLRHGALPRSVGFARQRPAVDVPGDPPPAWEVVAAEEDYPPEPRLPLRRRLYDLLGRKRVRSHGARYSFLDEPLDDAL